MRSYSSHKIGLKTSDMLEFVKSDRLAKKMSKATIKIPTSIRKNKKVKEQPISNNWDTNGNSYTEEKMKLYRRKIFDIELRNRMRG